MKFMEKMYSYPLEGYLFPATYDFYEEKPSLDDDCHRNVEKDGRSSC